MLLYILLELQIEKHDGQEVDVVCKEDSIIKSLADSSDQSYTSLTEKRDDTTLFQ